MNASIHRRGEPLDVAVDAMALQPSSGGIRVYLRELILHCPPEAVRFTLICSRSNAAAFADLPVRLRIIPWQTRSRVLRVLTQQLLLPVLLVLWRPRLLFAPVDIAPLLSPAPVLASMHSSHLNARAGFAGSLQSLYNRWFVAGTARRARRLIAISEYVAQESQRMLPAAAGKTAVVYHGGGLVEQALLRGWQPLPDAQRSGGILFIGTLHPHKRADALLRAYARLKADHPQCKPPVLHVVGHDAAGLTPSLRVLADQLGIRAQVEFHSRVDDAALMDLYARSRILVIPSAIEGFGLPAVEAMQAGLPVVVSDQCALPEIVGDAGLIADADDPAAFATAMAAALWDAPCRAGMIERGLRRGQHFTWLRCAEQTLAQMRHALAG